MNGFMNEIQEKRSQSFWKQDNEHTTFQNLWDTAKAVLRGKFIPIQAYLKKTETFQTNNLTPTPTRTGGTTTKTAQIKQKEGKNQDQSRVK